MVVLFNRCSLLLCYTLFTFTVFPHTVIHGFISNNAKPLLHSQQWQARCRRHDDVINDPFQSMQQRSSMTMTKDSDATSYGQLAENAGSSSSTAIKYVQLMNDSPDGELCILPDCYDEEDDYYNYNDVACSSPIIVDEALSTTTVTATSTVTKINPKLPQQKQISSSKTSSSSSSSKASSSSSSTNNNNNNNNNNNTPGQKETTTWVDIVLNVIPIVVPLMAYFSYEEVAGFSDVLTEMIEAKNFVQVDGGSYGATLIAPAINGVLMPACAVTFATLLSITISALRQRQQDISATINMEAGELRVLKALVDAFPASPTQDRCRTYLIQYTSRLIAESQRSSQQQKQQQVQVSSALEANGDSEMNGFLLQLIELSDNNDVKPAIQSESFSAMARLNTERSTRISALQASFPMLHYAVLSVLAVSICSAFLIETNQDVLVFLNAVQLRLLWAMLVGVFSGLAVVCYDLSDPFQGSYQISKSVEQLYTIRNTLRAAAATSAAAAAAAKQVVGEEELERNKNNTNGPVVVSIDEPTASIPNVKYSNANSNGMASSPTTPAAFVVVPNQLGDKP